MDPAISRSTTLLLPCLLSVLTACGRSDPPGEAVPAAGIVYPVTLASVSEAALPRQGSAPADVLSPNESQLSADVSARLERVYTDVGSTVRAGERLLQLEATDYRLALEQAEARTAAARAREALAAQRLERARPLVAEGFVSADQLQAIEAELESARADTRVADADRRVAARNVEKCLIVAPFDAAVVERFAQVGARIAAGSPLLRLIELSPPEVEAAVQSEVAAELAGATEYWFERQGRRHPLRLLRMAPVVERAARTQVTRFAFVDAPAPAGSSGTLYWRAPGQSLPAALLVKRDEVLGFFTARDGRARFVPAPGALEGRPVAVDLPADTMLVVRGQQALNDGDAIVDRAPGA